MLQDKVSLQHDTDADPKGRGVRTPATVVNWCSCTCLQVIKAERHQLVVHGHVGCSLVPGLRTYNTRLIQGSVGQHVKSNTQIQEAESGTSLACRFRCQYRVMLVCTTHPLQLGHPISG